MSDDLRLWMALGLVVFGSLVMAIGVYGMIRMPDVYTRLHAASKAIFLGVMPLLLAAIIVGDGAMISRSVLVAVFLLITTPVSSHAIGRAAYLSHEPMETPGAVDESRRSLP